MHVIRYITLYVCEPIQNLRGALADVKEKTNFHSNKSM